MGVVRAYSGFPVSAGRPRSSLSVGHVGPRDAVPALCMKAATGPGPQAALCKQEAAARQQGLLRSPSADQPAGTLIADAHGRISPWPLTLR